MNMNIADAPMAMGTKSDTSRYLFQSGSKIVISIFAFLFFCTPLSAAPETELLKLLPESMGIEPNFGRAVAMYGNWVMVGAHNADIRSGDSGQVQAYYYNGTNWEKKLRLEGTDTGGYDYFGFSIAISGNYAVIGAPGAEIGEAVPEIGPGAAYVFHYEGANWHQTQKLVASDGADNDQFGSTVDINDNRLIVGAFQDDDAGEQSGSAYVYHYEGDAWVQEQKLTATDAMAWDKFGTSVTIAGSNVLVGAPYDSLNDDETTTGSAYFFHHNGTTWEEVQKLSDNTVTNHSYIGHSVALLGNNAIVGGYGANTGPNFYGSGGAYIYQFDTTDPNYPNGMYELKQKLHPSDGVRGERFGFSVDIISNYAIVGAPWSEFDAAIASTDKKGSAYIYRYNDTDWIEMQKLAASDSAAGDELGYSVAISSDFALVGAPFNDDVTEGVNAGSAYIYKTPKGVAGDLNGDVIVDLVDAILALQIVVGQNPDELRSDYISSEIDLNDAKAGLEEAINALEQAAE